MSAKTCNCCNRNRYEAYRVCTRCGGDLCARCGRTHVVCPECHSEIRSRDALPCKCACCVQSVEFLPDASQTGFEFFNAVLDSIGCDPATDIKLASRIGAAGTLAQYKLIPGGSLLGHLDTALKLAEQSREKRLAHYRRRCDALGLGWNDAPPPAEPSDEQRRLRDMRHWERYHSPTSGDYCPLPWHGADFEARAARGMAAAIADLSATS